MIQHKNQFDAMIMSQRLRFSSNAFKEEANRGGYLARYRQAHQYESLDVDSDWAIWKLLFG